MKKILIFCPECKNFMLVNLLNNDHDLGQDMIPKEVADELEGQTCICEYCGVLHELRTSVVYRVDAKMVF